MGSVLGQQPLFQSLDTLHVALSIQIRAFFHGFEGCPALGIYDVCPFKGSVHIVGDGELPAGSSALAFGYLHHVVHQIIPFWIGQMQIHTQAAHKADAALGHGQGLAVGRRVGPGHGHLLAPEIFEAAQLMNAVESVGHDLGGVIDVALEVHQRGLLLQHAALPTFGHGVYHGVHVGVAFADIHIVPDADNIRHEGDHVSRLPNGLPVGYLALAFFKIPDGDAQQVAGGSKGEAGAGAVVTEDGNADAGIEDTSGDVVLPQMAQGVGHFENGLDLIIGFLPGQEEIPVVHLFKIQPVEDIGILLYVAHGGSPSGGY